MGEQDLRAQRLLIYVSDIVSSPLDADMAIDPRYAFALRAIAAIASDALHAVKNGRPLRLKNKGAEDR